MGATTQSLDFEDALLEPYPPLGYSVPNNIILKSAIARSQIPKSGGVGGQIKIQQNHKRKSVNGFSGSYGSTGSGQSYKPSNLANVFNNNGSIKRSSESIKVDTTAYSSNNMAQRSKSITSEELFDRTLSIGTNAGIQFIPSTTNIHQNQGNYDPIEWSDLMEQQKKQPLQRIDPDQQIRLDLQQQPIYQIKKEQQRQESIRQKQYILEMNKVQKNLLPQQNIIQYQAIPVMPIMVSQQPVYAITQQMKQQQLPIQQIFTQNQQSYYQFEQTPPSHQQQTVIYTPQSQQFAYLPQQFHTMNNPLVKQYFENNGTAERQVSTFSGQTLPQCSQLQSSSHCSSSGNISSSWLSQSYNSQSNNNNQQTTQNQAQSPCQCTSCLKQQMAQLQLLLQQQQQMFIQQTQNQLQQQQPQLSQHQSSPQHTKATASDQPPQIQSIHQAPHSICTTGSQCQNQSSSVWASTSNSQMSPQSHTSGCQTSTKGQQEEMMLMEERKSETEDESGSIPDEIELNPQVEQQTNEEQQQYQENAIMRKNYIELPLGEIPEMKESFYEEASRWSHIFGNQSRTKTPEVMSQSLKNNNQTSNSNRNARESQISRQQQLEEEKEDLFLYSQGESGATLNRTDNDSSFLTNEKTKINQCLQNEFTKSGDASSSGYCGQFIQSPPSYDRLKELSLTKCLIIENQKELHTSTKKTLEMQSMIQNEKDDVQMIYPASTDTKRPPLEYSPSSAKYMNQSLTLTPSQQMNGESSVILGQKVILNYDQVTPIQYKKQEGFIEDKAYQYLSSQQLPSSASPVQQFKQFNAVDCQILDFDNNYSDQSKSSIDQKEIILSPLPPAPFSVDQTALNSQQKPTPNKESDKKPNIQQSINMNHQRRNFIRAGQLQSRCGSQSYEKEKATKIINYILSSDQKQTGHHTMKSSIPRGFHKPNVLSQVNSLFPNIDDLLVNDVKSLRTHKNAQSIITSRNENKLQLHANTYDEQPIKWSETSSHLSKQSNQGQTAVNQKIKLDQPIQQLQIINSEKTTKSFTSFSGSKISLIDVKDPKIQPIPAWQSRNSKAQTQLISATKNLNIQPFELNDTTIQQQQRFRSLETRRYNHSDERPAMQAFKVSPELTRISLEKKSPFDRPKFSTQIQQKNKVELKKQQNHSPFFNDKQKLMKQGQIKGSLFSSIGSRKNNLQKNNSVFSIQKIQQSKTQQINFGTKYQPTVFDRLSKQNLLFPANKQKDTYADEFGSLAKTARDHSAKSRPSLDRIPVVCETRNSSCSSGNLNSNNSCGPKKRKFSKIIFEISELPSISMINNNKTNRSLSNNKNNNNQGKSTAQYSPIKNNQYHTQRETSTNISTNAEFIMTHENYVARTEEDGADITYSRNLTEENNPKRNDLYDKKEGNKAIVQSLLNKNENIGQQLSKLFGQKLLTKTSSVISECNSEQESFVYTSARFDQNKLNAYPTLQKQLSPNQRLIKTYDEQQKLSNKISSNSGFMSANSNQNRKVCLPNSIFFNQKTTSSGNQVNKQSQPIIMVKKGLSETKTTMNLEKKQARLKKY